MYKYKLLKSQRNKVLQLIKSRGLDPFNFHWSTTESANEHEILVPLLDYEKGEYYFQFDTLNEKNYSAFSPGENGIDQTQFPGNWDHQLRNVATWLDCLKREIDEPDLWSDIEKYRIEEDQEALARIVNEPFTVNQADQIQLGILKMRSYLEEFTKSNESQALLVNEQLDYLAEAAKRQGKRDWLHTSIGVIMSISVSLALAPNQAKDLWNILKTTLGGILQLPQ